MLVEWRPIEDFENYSVSRLGTIRNEESGRLMAMSVNQRQVVNVGLTRNCKQYRRAVGLLVASAYLADDRPSRVFDCTINLNGDRFNNAVDNLAWRPKWFAMRYNQQFDEAHFEDYHPILNLQTQEVFRTSWDAVRKHGLLHSDLILSIANGTSVWPIRQHFREIW
jgi:hypothetical protein